MQRLKVTGIITGAQNRGSFEISRESAIRSYKVYGTTVASRLYENDQKDQYFHIYYNPSRQAAERERFEQRIERLRQFLDKHIGKEDKFGRTYQNYFRLINDRKGIFLRADERYRRRRVGTDAVWILLHHHFREDDCFTGAGPVQRKGYFRETVPFRQDLHRLQVQERTCPILPKHIFKIFIEFITLIVRNRIYNLLKDQMILMESRQKYMTVPAAIRELEKIAIVRRNNGSYKLDYAVTKTQKTILSSFGLDETDVTKSAEKIGKQLASS